MALSDFLTYLSGAGVIAAVSFVFERLNWFQKLDSKIKDYVFFGACVVVALGAFAVKTYVPAAILEQIAPWFSVVATIFAYQFLGKGFHAVDKN